MNKLLTAGLALAVPLLGAQAAQEKRRAPAAAGHFYPAAPKVLAALVDKAWAAAEAAAAPAADIVALLVPHAGLEYSGVTAARAFKLLPRGRYDTVVVVGTCHYKELEGAALYDGDYGTPEGSLRYDAVLGAELLKTCPAIRADAAAHKREHSIEVELPFLRRALGADVKLVALVMNSQDLETARQIGRALAEASRGKRVLLVASSDLSHYPSGGVADAVDRTTLEALKSLDPAFFWLTNRFLMNRGLPHLSVTYCGEGAVTAVMAAARQLGATQASVLGRINSGDVVSEREYNHVVGYAAVAFAREPGVAAPARFSLQEKERKQLLAAARRAVEEASGGRKPAAPLSANPRFNLPAGVFVTLRRGSQLRGCMGTVEAQESLLEAVVRNAAAAATGDARFPAVAPQDAAGLTVELSLLSATHPAAAEDVKPGDGVTVELDGKSGVFLPEVWQTVPKKEDFLAELCAQKAGLARDCWKNPGVAIKTFSALSFSER